MERALDLVNRFNLEKTFDLAITLADRNPKLADLIEEARDRKFYNDRQHEDVDYDDDEETAFEGSPTSAIPTSRQISPDLSHAGVSNKRSLREDLNTYQQKKHKVF